MAQHLILGKSGEDIASRYLEKNGYVILEKNWRYHKAEVDLIALADRMLIMVEVKTRSTDYFGQPEEAVTKGKQKLLCQAANAYMELNKMSHEIRFDVISIISNKKQTKLHHIKDAFYPFASEIDE